MMDLVRPERFELPTSCFVGQASWANSMILQHGWQPKSPLRHALDTQVVPKWYSPPDHLCGMQGVKLPPPSSFHFLDAGRTSASACGRCKHVEPAHGRNKLVCRTDVVYPSSALQGSFLSKRPDEGRKKPKTRGFPGKLAIRQGQAHPPRRPMKNSFDGS